MAFVVHDLKNPVGTVDLHAQLLLRNKELPEQARSTVVSIRSEIRALMRLIMNLLDISKSEEGKLVVVSSKVDLGALTKEVIEAAEVLAKAKNIQLETALDVKTVRGDADLLRRVLENLIDNAVRHAPEDSVVRLSAADKGKAVELRLIDQGSGVPPELRERIFDPFVQVESKDRAVTRTGRGLGLAFCRLAVEAHGGRIWVEDGEPGAVICLSIPNAAPAP
jgi:signal transduction histidine kinase